MASTFEALLLAQVNYLQNNTPQLIGTTILGASAASISITIPSGYNHLQCTYTGRQDSGSGGAFCFVRINGDSGANYTWQGLYGNVSTATSSNAAGAVSGIRLGVLPGSGDTANYFGTGAFTLGNVGSAVFKPLSGHFQGPITTTNGYAGTYGGIWASTAAITSVALFPNSGNLIAGSSLTIYGLK